MDAALCYPAGRFSPKAVIADRHSNRIWVFATPLPVRRGWAARGPAPAVGGTARGGAEGETKRSTPEQSAGGAVGRDGPSRERRPHRRTGRGNQQRRRAERAVTVQGRATVRPLLRQRSLPLAETGEARLGGEGSPEP